MKSGDDFARALETAPDRDTVALPTRRAEETTAAAAIAGVSRKLGTALGAFRIEASGCGRVTIRRF
jgi:hypothetical protein